MTLARDKDQPAAGTSAVLTIPKLAAAIGAISLVAYQTWFMPFFQTFFAGREWLARPVFYALYGSILVISAVVLVVRPDVRRKILPFAIAAAIGIAAVALHPIGLVARAYIIALVLGGTTMVLMLGSAPVAMLRLSAAITALNAALCLLELPFEQGFTNVAGRAAGLAINANVAAAALLLGAAASYRAVPERLRASFFVLVGAGLLVTLSRSILITAVVAVGIPILVHAWHRHRQGFRPAFGRRGAGKGALGAAGLLALVLLAWIALALTTNPEFPAALRGVGSDVTSAATALDAAHGAVSASVEENGDSEIAPNSAAAPRVTAANDAAVLKAFENRLRDEGHRNTISARTLLLERALIFYRDNGFFGSGLEIAQSLAPHNSFVLFALAFGHLGWLIPLAVVAFVFYPVRDAGDLPLGLATLGTMLTSHDILLTPSLFLPIALGIAGMLAGRKDPATAVRTYPGLAYAVGVGASFFVLGCLVIRFASPLLAAQQLRVENIKSYGDSYVAMLETPESAGIFQVADGDALASDDKAYLLEGATALSRVEAVTSGRSPVRPGQYALTKPKVVVFDATDASDPRSNGRSYEIGLPLVVSPLFYVFLGAVVAWTAGTMLIVFRAARKT